MADDFDPFASGGYVPAPTVVAPSAQDATDPFAAGGYAPAPPPPQKMKKQDSAPAPRLMATDEFGTPIYDDESLNREMQSGKTAAAEKFGEGVTFGLLPHVIAGTKALGGANYGKSLQEARDYTKATSEQFPVQSALMEGAGSLAPTMLGVGLAAPATRAVTSALPRLGPYISNTLLGAGLGAASEAGHDVGAGTTENIGADALTGAAVGGGLGAGGHMVGQVLQAIPNMGKGLIAGARNMFTDTGRQGIAGQVLREASGDFPNQMARSPLPGLQLRTPQATGNPGLASLESTLASEPGMQGSQLGAHVQGNRTPDQVNALGQALVGSDAAIEPQTLLNQASQRGVNAVTELHGGLKDVERGFWSAPELAGPRFNSRALTSGVAQDAAFLPAGLRGQITEGGPLAPYMQELHDLPSVSSIDDLNAIRSNVLQVGRDARSGLQPDSKLAAASDKLADSILTRMGKDPSIAGAEGKPSGPAWEAYQKARDFTRQRAKVEGYDEFGHILNPNASGNMAGNEETMFGKFFDTSKGTSAGLTRLQAAADLARASGLTNQANELESAARDYMKSSVMGAARRGQGVDATGRPSISLPTLNSTVTRAMPAVNATPMMRPIAQDLQAAGNAAELMHRPSTLRGDTNSTTFEKLRNNDLIGSVIGQSGSSALGAAAGGYAGYQHGPEGLPAWMRIGGGMLAGGAAGRTVGPAAGKMLAHFVPSAVSGPKTAIQQMIWEALQNPEVYARMMGTPMLTGPTIGAPGMLSNAALLGSRALTPVVTGGGR